MSSFTASDGVLSGVSLGESCLYGMVDALDSNQGIDSRCDAATAMLTEETDESDVAVNGMVR